jgi:hypothetical protein
MEKYIVLSMLLISCGDKGESDPPPLNNNGPSSDPESCGGTPPVIESLSCINSGIQTHPDHGTVPTFTINVIASDEDADLTYYEMFLDIDPTLDGEKGADVIEMGAVSNSLSNNQCDVDETSIELTLYMKGGPPAFETTYEWYVQITDASGEISEEVGIECTTPDANGEGLP